MESIDSESVRVARIAKVKRGAALAVEDSKDRFRVKRRWCEPGQLSPKISQAIRTEGAIENDRLIHEHPLMWVLGILATERCEELAALQLQIGRQRRGLQIGFLEFNVRFVVCIELQHDVREP